MILEMPPSVVSVPVELLVSVEFLVALGYRIGDRLILEYKV